MKFRLTSSFFQTFIRRCLVFATSCMTKISLYTLISLINKYTDTLPTFASFLQATIYKKRECAALCQMSCIQDETG